MRAALSLGAQGLGRVWPNPAVGCVIVREARVVGRGRTGDGGRPHAETVALEMAGEAARGATAYVTLEPCAHQGRTPPCADGLVRAGIARVVAAMRDPDPRVDGGGFARLRSAGIDVTVGICEAEARHLQAGFLSRVLRGRPMVTLKLATTVDGRIATASGESRWITGSGARAHVHAQRALHDAVLVGAGTARADDPSLTVRGLGPMHQPVRVVASGGLDLDPDGRLCKSARESPVWVLHAPDPPSSRLAKLEARGVQTLACGTRPDGRLDLGDALKRLGERGLTRVYCEGGGTLAASLLEARLVDRLDLYSAGAAIGAEGVPALGGLSLPTLADAPRLRLRDTAVLGEDVLSRWEA
jgi:diaminohydroxyphosphoribosylaminopyrimidine deaminase/5-amino-6-(5-phosphoribosylamino)uracil reductase